MITATESGRKLVLTVGDGDDAIVVTVPPANTKTGAQILASWAGIIFDTTETAEDDAEAFARSALGPDAWGKLDELRWEESEQVIQAAFLWNVKGGGMSLVNTMLADGYPKAQTDLLEWVRTWAEQSQSRTSPSGESANPTLSQAGTGDTTTPTGSGSSFGIKPPAHREETTTL